ncbi:MAG: LytTR family DNA-binding domain-containing protein [Pseudomonadota bacterium]
MRTPHYWKFTLLFWLVVGLLYVVQAVTVDHWNRVLMRLLYFPVLGVALSAVMTLVFQHERFEALRWPAPWVVGLSAVSALITAMILNPITYLLLGIDLMQDHLRKMTTGIVGFGATYLFWSVLYFELDGRPLLGRRAPPPGAGHLAQLDVDDRGETRAVDVDAIECLAASGDYVHVHLADRSFLRKATITSLLTLLDPDRFQRIHRSTIVNAEHVVGVTPRGSGSFEIALASGRTVSSSRSYRAVVDELARRMP